MKKIKDIRFASLPVLVFLFLFLVSLIPLFDLFHPGLPITHDGQDHVARIANFYENLSQGILIPRWAENLNWGYGHPVMMFLYPLPSYVASFIHMGGFTLIDSFKIVLGLAFIISGMTMYLWLREFLGEMSGLVGGLLYLFAPYRFVDLYVRGALGEHVAFIFPPLVCYFLLRLSKKYSPGNVVGISLSLAGLILAHNAISLMFIPLIGLYVIFLFCQTIHKKSFLLGSIFALLGGFVVSAFFWVPAFFEGKFTLRDIVTEGVTLERFLPLSKFFYAPWSYGNTGEFTVQIGILHWLAMLASLPLTFFLAKRKNGLAYLTGVLLLLFCVTLFLMTPSANSIWQHLSLLQKFQFPWRFLSVEVFLTALCGSIVFSTLPKRFYLAGLLVVTFLLLFLTKDEWHAKAYLNKPETFFTSLYPGTTDTGESSPLWSIRFMEHYPKSHLEILDGSATIQEGKRTPIRHTYTITVNRPTRFKENTLFFPNWLVLDNGAQIPVEFQDFQNRGVLEFSLPPGKHMITVLFKDTKLRRITDAVSLVGLVFGLSYFILGRRIYLWLSSLSFLPPLTKKKILQPVSSQ